MNIESNINDQAKQNAMSFKPIFTEEQVHEMEDKYNTTWGVNRRILMMILTKNSDAMTEMVESIVSEDKEGGVFFTMVDSIKDYEQHLSAGLELAQAATARLLLIGGHVVGDQA
jgi:hypothetical protein